MAQAGSFVLIVNDGKADRLLNANQLLNYRLQQVACSRSSSGQDPTPTISDITRTHCFHLNAVFKPHVAIGYEYNKVRANSGTSTLGSSVQFSIPQFGDFFHDMVVRVKLIEAQAGTFTLPTNATAVGNFPANTPLNTYTLVDAFGNPLAGTDTSFRHLIRYCEFPGNRLFQKVKFDVNGNPLDEYDQHAASMTEKFLVSPGKRLGYNRCVGQENCKKGYSGLQHCLADPDTDGLSARLAGTSGTADYTRGDTAHRAAVGASGNTKGTHTVAAACYDASSAAKLDNYATADNAGMGADGPQSQPAVARDVDNTTMALAGVEWKEDLDDQYVSTARQCVNFADGPQTPKVQQQSLEIWNKLLFWFCNDPRLSIPSVSIPFGQRFITIDLAAQALLLHEFDNVYVRAEGQTTPASLGSFSGSHIQHWPYRTATGVRLAATSGTETSVTVSIMELYINNIFVNPEIHDIYIKRIGFSLIRVWRIHKQSISTETEILLSNLKWPIEYMFVCVQPKWNIDATNYEQHRDWHRCGRVVSMVCEEMQQTAIADEGSTGAVGSIAAGHDQVVKRFYENSMNSVDTLSLTSHGITIYDAYPTAFYNSYLPMHYGGQAINTPEDEGALFVNFCLFPRSYQPSSHLNVSRARETYLKWTTCLLDGNVTANATAVAVALNFLLITDGSAVLRYST